MKSDPTVKEVFETLPDNIKNYIYTLCGGGRTKTYSTIYAIYGLKRNWDALDDNQKLVITYIMGQALVEGE